MAGGYECLHVPIKGGRAIVKNPVALGGGAFFVFVVFKFYGIWPFVAVGGIVTAIITALVYFQIRGPRTVPMSVRTASMKPMDCIGNHGAIATTLYRVTLPSGERKEIPVCNDHIFQTEQWLARQQLTTG
jgi:hypothetical protein